MRPSSTQVGRQEVGYGGLQRTLAALGDAQIERIRLVRTPIFDNWAFRKVRDLATGGQGKIASHHDKTYHLYTELMLRDPVTGRRELIALEKNERINLKRGLSAGSLQAASGGKIGPDDVFEVAIPESLKGKLSLSDYIAGGRSRYRDDSEYFSYSLRNNNCQRFTWSHLKGSGLDSPAATEFTVQPMAGQIKPGVSSLIDRITGAAAAVVDRVYGP